MKKDEQLELNIKYTLGKKVYWFLFFKNHIKTILLLLLLILAIYFINTDRFELWLYDIDSNLTVNMLTLWSISLFVGIIILLLVSTFEKYHQHKFVLSEHSFNIRRGFFMVKEKVIPYRHIQNVDIEQPYHYRIIGLAKLNITTARMDNFDDGKTNLIPIIDKVIARKLSDFLIQQGARGHNNINNNDIL